VGANYVEGSITTCHSTCSVSGDDCVGGLVGNNDGMMTKCYSTGNVDGNDYVGGLVGKNCADGMIRDCYSTGSVSGGSYIGGLVGIVDGEIEDCYSKGSVVGMGLYVGGLVGYKKEEGLLMYSFWDIETSGQSKSYVGISKKTAEMKTMSTFTKAGWDFIEIWDIGENQTYPFLRDTVAGDLNHDRKVNLIDLAILASQWLEDNNL